MKKPVMEKPVMEKPVMKKPAIIQNSALLNLPLDLFYLIIDEIPFSAKVILSRTCRDLRYLVRDTHHLRNASKQERQEALTALGQLLPNHYLCINCGALHLVDSKDLPTVPHLKPCLLRTPECAALYVNPHYEICFRHVQLAIKYTIQKEINQELRANILRKTEISMFRREPLKHRFIAKPMIIHNRLVFHSVNIFSMRTESLSFKTLFKQFLKICIHHEFRGSNPPFDLNTLLSSKINDVFDHPTNDKNVFVYRTSFSCDYCPTDCVLIRTHEKFLVVIWKDLGTGNSLEDPYWRSHTLDSGNRLGLKGSFNYEHGSIRRAYLNEIKKRSLKDAGY